jgi:hypothetical protein
LLSFWNTNKLLLKEKVQLVFDVSSCIVVTVKTTLRGEAAKIQSESNVYQTYLILEETKRSSNFFEP